MNSEFIVRLSEEIQRVFDANSSEIEALDQAIGDGDHVINMKRGILAIVGMKEELAPLEPSAALNKIGMKLLSTIGGAAGPLFASLFMGMAKVPGSDNPDDRKTMAQMFSSGVEAVKKRGKSDIGEKTMLDVLIPVSNLFTQLVEEDASRPELLRQLKDEAEKGVLSTREMIATKGRASFLGERAKGHIDPGAKSCQLIISTICDEALKSEVS